MKGSDLLRGYSGICLRFTQPATIGTTDESFRLMVCFYGQEVTFMESAEDSEGNTCFMVAKELGPLRFLLSFNLARAEPARLIRQP